MALPPTRTQAEIEFDFYARSQLISMDEFRYFPILQQKFSHLLSSAQRKLLRFERELIKDYDKIPGDDQINLIQRAKEEAKSRLEALDVLEASLDDTDDINLKIATKHLPLTEQQLAAANLLLDFTDARTLASKLKSLGVVPAEYQTWIKDPTFQEYMRIRSEQILANSTHVATASLMRLLSKDDFKAVKFYFELSGRYSQSQQNQQDLVQNLHSMLFRVLEVIQTHVKDPVQLKAIARDLGNLSKELTSPEPVWSFDGSNQLPGPPL